jgi:heme exporter protein D
MKLGLALGAYAVLAVAAWMTLSDTRFRLATLVVLALIAVKTLLSWQRERREREHQEIEPM